MVKTAIIGLGAQGRKYAKIIFNNEIENLTLTAVTARSDESISWAEKNIPGVKVYPDYNSLLNNCTEFDSVIITTPHKTHCEIAIASFDKQVAVLCDKPSGISVKEAEKMNKIAKLQNIPFAIMFNYRVQPVYKWIKECITKGELGTVNRVLFKNCKNFRTQHYHNSAGWRSTWEGEGGGALINQGQHLLDLWCWYFGMPDKVMANVCYGRYNDFDVDDEATLIMKYRDMSGVFIISTGEPLNQDVIEISGTKGRILVTGNDLKFWKYEDSIDYMKKADVSNDKNIKYSIEDKCFAYEQKPYHIMLKNFADYVEGSAEPVARGEEGIYPLKIASLAYNS